MKKHAWLNLALIVLVAALALFAYYKPQKKDQELRLSTLKPADAKTVKLRQVMTERLLILKDGHCLRDETLATCDRARMRFAAQFEADQFVTIFELIRAGFGVSIVPDMARMLSTGCKLIEINPKVSRRVGYVRLERRYVSKAIEAFTEYLSS